MKYSIPIHNKKYTLISKKSLAIDIPDYIDRYEGNIQTIVHDINKHQFSTDQLYTAHIIISDNDITKFMLNSIIDVLPTLEFDHKQVYVNDFINHGEYKKNKIKTHFYVCDSYLLPIIGYQKRQEATEYGNILNHRGRLVRLREHNETFLKSVS